MKPCPLRMNSPTNPPTESFDESYVDWNVFFVGQSGSLKTELDGGSPQLSES